MGRSLGTGIRKNVKAIRRSGEVYLVCCPGVSGVDLGGCHHAVHNQRWVDVLYENNQIRIQTLRFKIL